MHIWATVKLIGHYTSSKISSHMVLIQLFLAIMVGIDFFSDSLINQDYWIWAAIGFELLAFIRHWWDGSGDRASDMGSNISSDSMGYIS